MLYNRGDLIKGIVNLEGNADFVGRVGVITQAYYPEYVVMLIGEDREVIFYHGEFKRIKLKGVT